MSFWPFPTTLLTELRAAAALGPLVEIGAGSGQLCARLRGAGLHVVPLDLRCALLAGLERAIVADARALPFRTGSIGALVLADFLRHLPVDDRVRVAEQCARVLVPGGRVLALEDAPHARDEAERNYRRVIDLLAHFDASRGRVGAIDPLTEALRCRFGPSTMQGEVENAERAHNPLAPLHWMRARMLGARSELPADTVAELETLELSIREHGLLYGRYEYRMFVHHEEEHSR